MWPVRVQEASLNSGSLWQLVSSSYHMECWFVFGATAPPLGQGLLIHEFSRSHITTHHNQDSSGQVISPSQRPLPDNKQRSQQTEVLAPGGIRTHNLSRRAAADLRFRPRGHWDRHHTEWKAENKLFERKNSSALKEERGAIFLGTCESGVVFEVRWADIWLTLELQTEIGFPHAILFFFSEMDRK